MRRRRLLVRGVAAWVVGAAFLPCCGGDAENHLTEIVVSIDSDLAVPGDANQLQVTVTDGEGNRTDFPPKNLAAGDFPLTIGLRAASNDARKFTVDATLKSADKTVLERKVTAEFVPNESRYLPVTLCGLCRNLACTSSCGEQGCTAEDVTDLTPWTGTLPARVTCKTCQPGAPLIPVRAFIASPPEWPHVCDPDNVLVKDDKVTGLDYAESDAVKLNGSFGSVGGISLPGCVGVDFGRIQHLDPIVVRARAVRDDTSVCGPPGCATAEVNAHCARCCMKCSSNFVDPQTSVASNTCEKGGTMVVFAGRELGVYESIGSKQLTNDPSDEKFAVPKDSQFIVVCRSADGPAAADVAVDAIWSEAACP